MKYFTKDNFAISQHTVERLSLYRRTLADLLTEGTKHIFSHQLAALSGATPAQVRRDIMALGYSGSPILGYDVQELSESISELLDGMQTDTVAIVGLGNLGRAILAHFAGRHPKLSITAGFDTDPDKVNRVLHGCRCYLMSEMADFLRDNAVKVAIIAVPASKAQAVADILIRAGVSGILNYAPTRLRVPPDVYVENRDMTTALEKVAYFARLRTSKRVETE